MAVHNAYEHTSAIDAAFLTKTSTPTSVPPGMVQTLNPTASTYGVPIISQTESPTTTTQPPALSTTFLVLITAGMLLLLSLLALMLYCYVRFRRHRKARRCTTLDKVGEIETLGNLKGRGKGRWDEKSESGKMNNGYCISPSAFDFSPPSPTWRPILPSLAIVSGKHFPQAHLSNAEKIMLESEGKGRTTRDVQRNGGAFDTSGTFGTISHPQCPAESTRTMRGIVGMKNTAFPIPPTTSGVYRPPAYHYSSRILPRPKICIKATPIPTRKNSTHIVHFPPATLVQPVPRIQVHCVQDSYAQTLSNGMHHLPVFKIESDGLETKRMDAVKSSRPNSGLGITMIDLNMDAKHCKPSTPQPGSTTPYLSRQSKINSCKTSTALFINDSTSHGDSKYRKKLTSNVNTSEAAPSLSLLQQHIQTFTSNSSSAESRMFLEMENDQDKTCNLPRNRANTSRRQGVCEDSIDNSVKNELHGLRSLGSESFDNLIEYLAESPKPMSGARARKGFTPENSHNIQHLVDCREKEEYKVNEKELRVTREQTEKIDNEAYEKWARSLNADSNLKHDSRVLITREALRSRRSPKAEFKPRGRVILGEWDTSKAFEPDYIQAGEEEKKVFQNGRISVHENSSMHVRALRARSAMLKVKNQTKVNSTRHLESDSGDAAQHHYHYSPVNETADRMASLKTFTTTTKAKQTIREPPRDNLSTTENQNIAALPSFSLPSSDPQLYMTFPSTEASFSTTRSVSSVNNTKIKSVPTQAFTSQSPNSMSMSAAAYIARCASTPYSKSTAFLSFLSPSSPSINRQSVDTVSSMGSEMSSWGRRSDLGRESLTPRFNHLRAVLEGHFEDPPPLPTNTRLQLGDEIIVLDRGHVAALVLRSNTINDWL